MPAVATGSHSAASPQAASDDFASRRTPRRGCTGR
jgi:hypothetical protein